MWKRFKKHVCKLLFPSTIHALSVVLINGNYKQTKRKNINNAMKTFWEAFTTRSSGERL